MKITVTFDLNEPQWESVKRQAELEPWWHFADLLIRHNGEDKRFQADYMRAFFREVRKAAGIPSHFKGKSEVGVSTSNTTTPQNVTEKQSITHSGGEKEIKF